MLEKEDSNKKLKVSSKVIKKVLPKEVNSIREDVNNRIEENSEVVKKTRRRLPKISSGIKNLDNITGGGFEKNSINLIVGSGGSGKSIFGIQFLIEGIKKNEKCLYITFEEKKNTFYSNMLGLGWDLEKLEKQGKFFFIEYTPEKVKTMLEEGGGAIEPIVLGKEITRIVMDSLTSFSLLFTNELLKRRSVLSLFNILRKWNATSLLIYEGDTSKGKEISPDVLEFESDSTILLYFLRTGEERERYMEVLKMRGTKHSKNIYSFSIKDKGIVLSKNPTSKELKF